MNTNELTDQEKVIYDKILAELGSKRVHASTPRRSRRKKRTANRVLALLGLFLLAFIVTMIVTYWVKGAVPDTLIQYTLGAGGVEALVLAGIKISKVVKGENTDEN